MAEYFLGQIQKSSLTITQIYSGVASRAGEYSMSGKAEDFDFLVVIHGYGVMRKIDWIKTDIADKTSYSLVYGVGSATNHVNIASFSENKFTIGKAESGVIYGIFGIKL